eukprot:CAMPEP_0172880322 /NCGR_PEP_ID=MMETSP1075-20121228/114805_1 /TAXON_ID=2916 /ORGANISM="Ceratium fusus, Strain PA161109" /LENGTH=111 /DNA_ID=CAMNT_0013732525 /DNA_START=82 /DNA_END=417 /DNA_ORIENTATION=-
MFECIILLPNRQGYTKWVQCDTSPGPMLRNTLLPTCHAWPLLDIPCVTNSNLTVGNFSDVTTKESDGQLQCLNAAFFACFFCRGSASDGGPCRPLQKLVHWTLLPSSKAAG